MLRINFHCFLFIPACLALSAVLFFASASAHAQTTATTTPQENEEATTADAIDTIKLYSEIFEFSIDDLSDGAIISSTATTSVTLPPVTSTPLTVELKELSSVELPEIAWASTTTSTVWQIDVRGINATAWMPAPYLTVTFPVETPFYYKKTVYFWDSNHADWRALPSKTDFDRHTVSAAYPLPYGRFIVRDDPAIYEGIASWYRWKNGNYAAFRFLPKQSTLKVTNISGSPRHGKSVTVRINDYGPEEWTERLIDLDYYAYRQIGIPRGGIMPVRVEILTPKP